MGILDKLKSKKKGKEFDFVCSEENIVVEENILYMARFRGIEQYPVKTAEWYIIDGDGTEDDPAMLSLDTAFGIGNGLHEDTAELNVEPMWKILFYSVEIPITALQPGFCLEQPNFEKDVYGDLYYAEHQPTTRNRMEILQAEGTRLKIRLTGTTEDVNFYDGSKPQSTLQLVAWFDRK